ncbi:hypothetical protein HQ560_00660 [bacterium]|nr:hypothetical protein [bacterium]
MKDVFVWALLCAAATLTAFAAEPREIDLASDTAWTLQIDGGKPRPIKVPGGGWNSDSQSPRIPTMEGVRDHVVYQRVVDVPRVMDGQITTILFGAVNYGAEVYIDGKLVTAHENPYVPFEADISRSVRPGQSHTLSVKAYHRRHYHGPDGKGKSAAVPVGFDFPKGSKHWAGWAGNTKFAYGITTSIRLAVYPPAYIKDVFVRPSVRNDSLGVSVWVHNGADKKASVRLGGLLSSWDNDRWKYPTIPATACPIGPGETREVSLGPVAWGLGKESYWWPNIPFDEDYKARLHYLDIDLTVAGRVAHRHRRRFGFVEHGEGPYYYTVNGVRVTGISDSNSYGQVGEFDCWSRTPCFLPPNGTFKGCPETWKRYQRIGFNTMRLSTSVPTPYMLETADEAGFMLVPEGGSWGNGTCRFSKEGFSAQLQGVIRACRNHPSVARYSMANESFQGDGGPWRWLIDAAWDVDPTRPYVFEVNPGRGTGTVAGMEAGHAWRMQHYAPIVEGGDFIRGMGECCWGTDEVAPFAFAAREFRMRDWAYFAPWSWVNFWPNFLEGMSHDQHPWKANNHPDRHDGVDGWGSPVIRFVQKSLHPYLVVDHELRAMQPLVKRGARLTVGLLAETRQGDGSLRWPGHVPQYGKRERIERKIEIFNGGLFGETMGLRWSARWDTPDGEVALTGDTIGPFVVKPGFHTTQTVTCTPPDPARYERKLYLVLESIKDGETVFVEDAIYFIIGGLRWTKVDDRDSTVSYSPDWKTWTGNPSYRRTEHYSQKPGATATFTFSGTNARFYGCLRNDLGFAEISVDGEVRATVDLYRPHPEYTKLFETDELPVGEHTLQIKVTRRKNSKSKAHYVIVDAFDFATGDLPEAKQE